MLQLINLQNARPQYKRQLKRLYKQAFPWYERKPWALLERVSAAGNAELLAVSRGRGQKAVNFCGLAICLFWQDIVLLDYLAVEPKMRSLGLGGQIMPLLLQRYPDKRLLLESERPGAPYTNLADCQRRLRFYQKCGLQNTGVAVRLYISDYLLLWSPGAEASRQPPVFADYQAIYNGLFGPMTVNRLHIEEIFNKNEG